MGSKILVTGGTGFLGRHIVERLIARGDKVRVLARNIDIELSAQGVEFVEGSLLESKDVREAIKGVKYVFHLAGRVERDPDQAHKMYELHVDGTRRLLDALRGSKLLKKVIVASTSGTVGVSDEPDFIANDDSPMAEQVVNNWPYYLSKIYAERVCKRYFDEHGLPIVLMRPTLLLGPGDHRTSSTGDVVKFLQRKIPTLMTGGLSFVDVRDTADAFISALENGEPGESYLLGAKNLTVSEFMNELEFISGVPGPKLPMPSDAAITGARLLDGALRLVGKRSALDPITVEMATHYWYIDSTKAERALGFTPRDPQLTLKDTVRWIRKHHEDFGSSRSNQPEDLIPRETLEWAESQASEV